MRARNIFSFLLLLTSAVSQNNNNNRRGQRLNQIYCDVPPDYDREVAPVGTIVTFEYKITNFDVIDVQDYSFTVRMNLILSWNDSRLQGWINQSYVVVDNRHQPCYWIPRISAQELKSMKQFNEEMTKPYLFFLRGQSIYSAGYMFKVACSMDLTLYPADLQKCSFAFFTVTGAGFRLKLSKNFFSIQSDISTDLTYDVIQSYEKDNPIRFSYHESDLELVFVFARRLPLYLMITYFPSTLVTIVSFTSFWISPEAVPGRVTLGVTCLLALMTQMVSVRSNIMNVNYVTAIDIWFLACITFVAFSLFGFAVSYTKDRGMKIDYMRVNVKNPTLFTRIRWRLLKYTIDQWSRVLFPFTFTLYTIFYSVILWMLIRERKVSILK